MTSSGGRAGRGGGVGVGMWTVPAATLAGARPPHFAGFVAFWRVAN